MRKYILTFAIFLFQNTHAQININGDFEKVSTLTKAPTGWALSSSQPQGKAYSVKVDSIDKLQGKYSVSIEKIGIGSTAGFASFIIPQRYAGKEIELRGFMKTQKIENGFAGLWLRLDSRDRMVSFDNMQKRNIKGTTVFK